MQKLSLKRRVPSNLAGVDVHELSLSNYTLMYAYSSPYYVPLLEVPAGISDEVSKENILP